MRLLLTTAVLVPALLQAQWQPVAVPTTDNLFSIDSYDAQRWAIGTASAWLRSIDGGNTWQQIALQDGQGSLLIGSTFTGMEHRSATELLGVGLSLANTNPFEVRRSTNSGNNWSVAYQASGDGFLSSLNQLAFNGLNGVAVGDLGRIARSTNGGVGWSTANTSGDALHDVAWCNATTVVTVGAGRILRSTNGGQSWSTAHTFSGTLYAVSFVNATTGYAAGTVGDLLRTTDGGATWQPLGATIHPDIPFFRDLWFTSATEAYGLCADRIVHSSDGGLHWAWYDAGAEMRQLCFQSATNGFAVGFNGTVLRTGGSGEYHPWAVIDGPNFACHDSVTNFVSESGPGLSHQWWVNGDPAGTGQALDWTFTEQQQYATVTLAVGNGTWTDTTELQLYVSSDLSQTINASIGSTSVCSGSATSVQVQASQPGRVYRLYRGGTPQGNAQSGNGNTLIFPTGTINAPVTFHLVGTISDTQCGTAVDTVSFNVTLGNPDPALPVSPGPITVCRGDTVTITIAGSQTGVNYQLRRNNLNVGTAQPGNGGDLSFIVGPLLTSANYTVFATNTGNNCTSTLSGNVPVTVSIPQPAWGPTSFNPQVGVPIDLMNSSNTFGGTYAWTIPGGDPPSSTSFEPTAVTFSTPGTVAVQLVGITPQGCSDTLVQVLHVLPTLDPQACGVAQWSFNGGAQGDAALTVDAVGNMIGYHLRSGHNELVALSGAGDTLFIDPPVQPNYEEHGHLIKFDAFGVPQWAVDLWHNSIWAEHADLITDEEGNIYSAYFHGEYLDSLRIVDASGARTTINPPHNGGGQRSVVVMSFTPNGRLRWVRTFLESYATEDLNMELDGQGHLLVQATNNLVQYDRATGTQTWIKFLSYGYRDHSVLPNDHIVVTERFDMVMREYDNAGNLLNTTPAYTPTPPANGLTRLNGWESACDPAGGIYQLHNLQGGVIINADTLYCDGNTGNTNNTLYFVTKRDPTGAVAWLRTFAMNSTILIHGLVANDERVLLSLAFFYTDTLNMQGLDPVPFHEGDTWVLSWALDGSAPQATRIHAHSGNSSGMYLNSRNAIALSPDGDRLALWAPFQDPLIVGTDTAFSFSADAFSQPLVTRNNGLVFGALDCVLGAVPNTNAPQAFFDPPTGYCTAQELPFADASLFGATSWLWEFPGGEPSSSTDADPVVTYTLPGTYAVTLTATNANGSSIPFTAEVFVDVCTALNDAADQAWRAWPNPARDLLHIQGPGPAEGLQIDLQGRPVWSGRLGGGGTINTRGLAAGTYVLLLERTRMPILITP